MANHGGQWSAQGPGPESAPIYAAHAFAIRFCYTLTRSTPGKLTRLSCDKLTRSIPGTLKMSTPGKLTRSTPGKLTRSTP
eukprot:4794709-Pyramimonas_sp.AAC.1